MNSNKKNIRTNKNRSMKNKNKNKSKRSRGNNNTIYATTNAFTHATLVWSFILDSSSGETSFGIKTKDVFLYLREQYEIDATMKLWFKISSGTFIDYCYRGHESQVLNFPTIADQYLSHSSTRQFWPSDFSKPSKIYIKWNKTTRDHTFAEDEPDTFLSIFRIGKPISETIKSQQAVISLNIRWRTVNDDPLRMGVTEGINSLEDFLTQKVELPVKNVLNPLSKRTTEKDTASILGITSMKTTEKDTSGSSCLF